MGNGDNNIRNGNTTRSGDRIGNEDNNTGNADNDTENGNNNIRNGGKMGNGNNIGNGNNNIGNGRYGREAVGIGDSGTTWINS